MNTALSEHAYLTRLEAAVYLRISTRALDSLIARNDLKAFRPGRKLLFKREDLDAYVQRYPINAHLSTDEAIAQ